MSEVWKFTVAESNTPMVWALDFPVRFDSDDPEDAARWLRDDGGEGGNGGR